MAETPSPTELESLKDGRDIGDYRSHYPREVWVQIGFELVFVVALLIYAVFGLLNLAVAYIQLPPIAPCFWPCPFPNGDLTAKTKLLSWLAIAFGGLCGGCAASLKWLYHTVAKKLWHRDRVLWRLIVPLLSSVLSVFTGLMIHSGLIPFVHTSSLLNLSGGAAFGFFVGLFSDNVLASLQRVALKIFGNFDQKLNDSSSNEP